MHKIGRLKKINFKELLGNTENAWSEASESTPGLSTYKNTNQNLKKLDYVCQNINAPSPN